MFCSKFGAVGRFFLERVHDLGFFGVQNMKHESPTNLTWIHLARFKNKKCIDYENDVFLERKF